MEHPFQEDFSDLKDSEIEQKIQDLSKKYWIAYKTGNKDLLTQLDTFLIIYKQELSKRYLERSKEQFNGDLESINQC